MVIGIQHCVMVAVGDVIGLWLWLVEKGSDVTYYDISVMFTFTHEITHVISCDFLAAHSKNPSLLVQP